MAEINAVVADNWTRFDTDENRIVFLQKYKLLGKSGKKRSPFMYKGIGVDGSAPCEIAGYVREYNVPAEDGTDDPWCELAVNVDGTIFVINSAYFAEMQNASFMRNQS